MVRLGGERAIGVDVPGGIASLLCATLLDAGERPLLPGRPAAGLARPARPGAGRPGGEQFGRDRQAARAAVERAERLPSRRRRRARRHRGRPAQPRGRRIPNPTRAAKASETCDPSYVAAAARPPRRRSSADFAFEAAVLLVVPAAPVPMVVAVVLAADAIVVVEDVDGGADVLLDGGAVRRVSRVEQRAVLGHEPAAR